MASIDRDRRPAAARTAANATAAKAAARLLWFGQYPAGQTVASFLIGLLITAALSISPGTVSAAAIHKIDPTATGALYICYEVLLSFAGHVGAVELLALACLLTFPVRYVLFGRRDSWRPSVVVPALVFAACMVLGRSYDLTDTAALALGGIANVIESIISGAGWALLAHVGIYLLFESFDWLGAHRARFSETRYGRLWGAAHLALDRHPFAGPFLLICLIWLPTFLGSMPGVFMGDTGAQIRQWFNLPNGTSDYLNLINPHVLLNGHHPVAHTALLGGCVQLGMALFGDENAGVLLYTTIQYLLTAAATAYMLSALRQMGAGLASRSCVLAFFLFMPLFPNYAVLITKDVIFGDAVLLLVVQMAKLLTRERAMQAGGAAFTRRDWALLLLAGLGCTFFRNGGAAFPAAACFIVAAFSWRDRSVRRHVALPALAVLAVVIACLLAFNDVLMPALQITPGSRREVLSIPFQQTARFVQKHDGANAGVKGGTSDGLVTPEEREIIDKVLRYRDLGSRYDPDKSDAVKNAFNEDATSADLAAYFRVWAEMFARDPEAYLSAVANNYYGYFYPSSRSVFFYSTVSGTEIMSRRENTRYFDFHLSDSPVRVFFDHANTLYRVAVQCVPLASLTLSSASYVWLLLACVIYLLRARRWRAAALFVPLLGILAVCLIGPCNGSTYMRYLYPAIVSLPFALVATICNVRQSARDGLSLQVTE